MKAKTGFFQELQADGSISNSFIRGLSALFFILLCGFVVLSYLSYKSNIAEFIKLLKDKNISEQSFNVLFVQTKMIDWDILLLLVTATVAPKVIQKFAEAKTGVKDTTETNTETSSSKQTIKTTV
jgi:biotin transporter BioY